jgi:hypothetical protein
MGLGGALFVHYLMFAYCYKEDAEQTICFFISFAQLYELALAFSSAHVFSSLVAACDSMQLERDRLVCTQLFDNSLTTSCTSLTRTAGAGWVWAPTARGERRKRFGILKCGGTGSGPTLQVHWVG